MLTDREADMSTELTALMDLVRVTLSLCVALLRDRNNDWDSDVVMLRVTELDDVVSVADGSLLRDNLLGEVDRDNVLLGECILFDQEEVADTLQVGVPDKEKTVLCVTDGESDP